MQRIVHEYRNKSRIFGMIEGLYSYVSDNSNKFDDILWLDNVFEPLTNILSSNILSFVEPVLKHFDMPIIEDVANNDKEITVCFSGGKDSAACAYYYLQKGYKVHLYHATGINKAYGDERLAAQKLAKSLGCKLFVDHIWSRGTHGFIEHPMKNYIIANGAIHYCLAMGYTPRIAFGNFNKSKLEDNPFEVCAGDCIEMWDVYRPIIQKVLPEFDIELPLSTNADTFEILSENWELLDLSVSCMSPYRFRQHWKNRTETKYGVKLFNNRCGCCWKDCMEWLWLADTGKVEWNEDYYIHCYETLERTMYREMRYRDLSPEVVWNNYMFYPFTDSKLYEKLKDRKVRKWQY